MKVSKRAIQKIIREEVDDILASEDLVDIEAKEDAWSGGENLAHPLDHSEVAGSEPATTSQEVVQYTSSKELPNVGGVDTKVLELSEASLRRIIRNCLQG